MTKTLIIAAALVTTMAASGSALAAFSDGAGHGPQFTNITKGEQLRRDRQYFND